MKLLVAIRERETNEFITTLNRLGGNFFLLKKLSPLTLNSSEVKDIHVALIDEDFDGPETGWVLASSLRKADNYKIVMIVRSNPTSDKIPLYDTILSYPISESELLNMIKDK